MKKQLNPLQPLIDELSKELTMLKESVKGIYEIGGVGAFILVSNILAKIEVLEKLITILAKFNFWNDTRTNPPKFDVRRAYPNRPDFLVVVKIGNGSIQTDVYPYRFDKGEWVVPKSFEVLYWQELPILPKSLLK